MRHYWVVGATRKSFIKISITIATSGRLRLPPRRAVPARPAPSARPAPGPGRPRSPGLRRPWGCAAQLIAWRSLPVPQQPSACSHAAFEILDLQDLICPLAVGAAPVRTSDRAGCTPRSGCGKAELLCTPICDS